MSNESFQIEAIKPFSESLIWQLNRDFYNDEGIAAWSDNIVPHHMTSNSMVGKTYAELIMAFLRDLGKRGKTKETVYILELGAGHGRLAFHVLKHLQKLVKSLEVEIPPFCYVLSDIVEENLNFFLEHPQFKTYLDQGILDVSYFDGLKSKEIYLRFAKTKICRQELNQPILAIANYFFDSLPNDLFLIKDKEISACSIELNSKVDPSGMNSSTLIKNIDVTYHNEVLEKPFYQEEIRNQILEDYRDLVSNTYLFFPKGGMTCLTNLKDFSKEGLMLLSMDKGFHEITDLEKKLEPDIVAHGSFSIWVNYHALGALCEKQGGKAFFPSYSTFHLDIGCLLFLQDSETYVQTDNAFQRVVNDFGPDDFNSMKKIAYFNMSRLTIQELIALIRLSAYDSIFFIKLLPRFKQAMQSISFNQRKRIGETLHQVWDMYFNISEELDLAYEIGGIFYDLGFYKEALVYFENAVNSSGQKADLYYNKALCHYQLRQDALFVKTMNEGKTAFPDNEMIAKLEKLDLGAS